MTTPFTQRYWIAADGVRLAARDYAAVGETGRLPVICLHGLTRNCRDFEDLAPRIAETGRRVIAMDVRGRGLSGYDLDPTHYAPPFYAADVAGFAAALDAPRALVVGTSMGGLIAMTMAAFYPDYLAGALLNDIGPEIGLDGLKRISAYAGSGPSHFADWAAASDYARATNAAAFPDYGPEDWRKMATRIFRQTDKGLVLDYDPAIAEGFKTADPDAPPPDLWPLFDLLAKGRPLALCRGATSDILEAQAVRRMALAAPHMLVAEVTGIGHAPMLDEPEALDLVFRFLQNAP